jgi:hypothetical protein
MKGLGNIKINGGILYCDGSSVFQSITVLSGNYILNYKEK